MFTEGFQKTAASFGRAKYVKRDIDKLDPTNENEAWTAKIDGAHTLVKLKKNELPALYSHRISKRTGGKISYNEKLPHIKTRSSLTGQFRGETFATDQKGRAVEPTVVTSILNSKPERSLKLQKDLGLITQTALIDVDRIDHKKFTGAPFDQKRKLMEEVVAENPEFTLPEVAYSPKQKMSLLGKILSGKHPQTSEGIIGHHRTEADKPMLKAKIFDEHDVHIVGIYKETGERKGMAGGIEYSWKKDGPAVGRVGSGFDFETKKDMLKNPEDYVGRVARVSSLGVSKNRVLLKPVFRNWHVEKNLEPEEPKGAKQTVIISKDMAKTRAEATDIAKPFSDRIYTSRETSSSFRFRQLPPKVFVPGSFRTFNPKPGISIVYGELKEDSLEKAAKRILKKVDPKALPPPDTTHSKAQVDIIGYRADQDKSSLFSKLWGDEP